MGFGTSDGTYYENAAQYALRQPSVPPESDYNDAEFKASGIAPAANGHGPDTFKLPNHITFSTESKYHGKDGNEGGQWQKLDTSDDGQERWSFTPGATNFKHHSLTEMQDYFKKYEPGNVLNAEAFQKPALPKMFENDASVNSLKLHETQMEGSDTSAWADENAARVFGQSNPRWDGQKPKDEVEPVQTPAPKEEFQENSKYMDRIESLDEVAQASLARTVAADRVARSVVHNRSDLPLRR